jgi:glucose/arabinose dehydrogenase
VRRPIAHRLGCIKFGPDGFLWFARGDGGLGRDRLPTRNAQDPTNLLGAMQRLNVSGRGTHRVPKDNPFVGDARVRDEIWAYGLRAPWRFSFAPDGSCWLGGEGRRRAPGGGFGARTHSKSRAPG